MIKLRCTIPTRTYSELYPTTRTRTRTPTRTPTRTRTRTRTHTHTYTRCKKSPETCHARKSASHSYKRHTAPKSVFTGRWKADNMHHSSEGTGAFAHQFGHACDRYLSEQQQQCGQTQPSCMVWAGEGGASELAVTPQIGNVVAGDILEGCGEGGAGSGERRGGGRARSCSGNWERDAPACKRLHKSSQSTHSSSWSAGCA